MKQEYHYTISRSDRIWLIVFVLFLLSWELVKYALPAADFVEIQNNNFEKTDSSTIAQINERKNKYSPYRKSYPEKGSYAKDPFEKNEVIIPFPIHEATYYDLRSAGLSTKVANNILKYISAGGKVKNANELMKIYGMDSSQLKSALPYLIYPTANKVAFADSSQNTYSPNRSIAMVDLNKATVLQLDSLPGIGLVLAERIIKFKEGLGGFFEVNQLKDIYGLPPETFEKIVPYLSITSPPDLLHINDLDLTNFTHPYLNKRFPKMIKAYRDHHGPFMNVSDLRKVYPPDSTWCNQILPYINFN